MTEEDVVAIDRINGFLYQLDHAARLMCLFYSFLPEQASQMRSSVDRQSIDVIIKGLAQLETAIAPAFEAVTSAQIMSQSCSSEALPVILQKVQALNVVIGTIRKKSCQIREALKALGASPTGN